MAWQAYRWIWRLESPVHVGLSPAGSLNRTRIYIPARTMWGALTAVLARQTASGAWPNYQGIGKDLQEKARFSYLYPAEQVSGQWQPWLPRYEEGQGLCWQRQDGGDPLSDRIFRQRLLATHPGTAIDPASDSAAGGTLREVEYILPRWRDTATLVALVGYVFLRDGNDPHGLKDVEELWIGGEGRYGFGCLRRVRLDGDLWQPASDCFGIPLDLGGSDPILQNPQFIRAHTPPEGEPVERGAWEVVLGWDCGSLYTEACVFPCWAPGSKSKGGKYFRIQGDGLWHLWVAISN